MAKLATLMNTPIIENCRAVLYICKYTAPTLIGADATLEVIAEQQFASAYAGLEAYSNTRNPESQLASGNTAKEFEQSLVQLHNRMKNTDWVNNLIDYL